MTGQKKEENRKKKNDKNGMRRKGGKKQRKIQQQWPLFWLFRTYSQKIILKGKEKRNSIKILAC